MNLFKIFAITIMSLGTGLALALSDDRSQPIHIEADSAELNERDELMSYTGNVVIRQGTISITAERVEIHSRNQKTHSVISTGNPARYQQQPESEGGPLKARGNRIEYLLGEKRVILIGNASLTRDGTLIKGESIEYDLEAETWNARGDSTGETKRIQLVIPPTRLDNGDGDAAANPEAQDQEQPPSTDEPNEPVEINPAEEASEEDAPANNSSEPSREQQETP